MMGIDLTDLIMGIVAGTEQIVIVIAIAVLIFGAKKAPELARAFGRATSEYEKAQYEAKNDMQRIRNPGTTNILENREKLEAAADTLETKYSNQNSQELRAAIQREIEKDKKKSLIVNNNNNNVCLLREILSYLKNEKKVPYLKNEKKVLYNKKY